MTARVRVAVDATPLLGRRTGVGTFVSGALRALAAEPSLDLDLSAYALSLRGGRRLPGELPSGVRAIGLPLPAGALLRAWSRVDRPTAGPWFGRPDVVHGTNFAVPPNGGHEVVTVHDLTPLRFPQMAGPGTDRFVAILQKHYPTWREARAELNELPLTAEVWNE